MATSSNRVRVAVIPEVVYGETPVAGNFATARFTSEALSGTPDTVESQQIRIDRQSSGQVVTGLQVSGSLNFELAKEPVIDGFLESLLYNTWDTALAVVEDLTLDVSLKTLTRAAGDWATDPKPVVVGDVITLNGVLPANAVSEAIVTAIVSATVIEVEVPKTAVDATATGYKRADKLTIANTKKSFSVEKQFTDLITKGINYRGMIVDQLEINVAFGELVTGSLTLNGNDYQTAALASELMTNGRTVTPPANTQTLNGSIDLPIITTNALGTFSSDGLEIQSLNININNNHTAQNVIGNIAPRDYTPGTTLPEIGLSAYLTDGAWPLLGKKLTQEPFSIGFLLKNSGGFYGVFLPAVQLTFEDPASGGQNQDVLFDATGLAKVGDNGESAIVFYKS